MHIRVLYLQANQYKVKVGVVNTSLKRAKTAIIIALEKHIGNLPVRRKTSGQ
jgi:hypothetical protein